MKNSAMMLDRRGKFYCLDFEATVGHLLTRRYAKVSVELITRLCLSLLGLNQALLDQVCHVCKIGLALLHLICPLQYPESLFKQ